MYQAINYHRKTNKIHIWDDEHGYKTFQYKPYAYIPDAAGTYQSLNGTKLIKIAILTIRGVVRILIN